jgi:hypothetical protein
VKVLAPNMTRVCGGLFVKEIIGREEGDYMTRWHLTPWDLWPFRKRHYLHVFERPDLDPWPHDHPFGFRSIVLRGGYTERVYCYRIEGDRVITVTSRDSDNWYEVRRRPLTSHRVPASHTHKIMKLHGRRTVTWVIRPAEKEQDWGFFVHTHEHGVQKVPWWQYLGLPEPHEPAYGAGKTSVVRLQGESECGRRTDASA